MTTLTFDRSGRLTADQQLAALALAVTGVCLLALGLVVLGWGLIPLVGTLVALTVLFFYPRQGLYVAVAAVTLAEGSSAYPSLRELTFIYRSTDHLTGIPVIPFSPLEMGLGVILLGLVKQRGIAVLSTGELFWPWLAVLLAVIPGIFYGVATGGDRGVALTETRMFFYIPLVYFLAINLVREKKHLYQLGWVIVAAVSVMAIGALWTHFTVIRPGLLNEPIDVAFLSHENALFVALVVLMGIGSAIWGQNTKQRLLMAAACLIALASLLIFKRRVGIIALDIGLILMTMAFIRHNWRLAVVLLPLVFLVLAGYTAAYWNSSGGLGQGPRAVRAVLGMESEYEDLSSKTYREAEAANVEANIRWHPMLGSGFGKQYVFVEPVADLTDFWSFQIFTPHNSVLSVWMKGGIVPFILLMAAFGYSTWRGMLTARTTKDPQLRAWCLAAAGAVPMVFVFAWEDLGLLSARTATLLAVSLAFITLIPTFADSGQQPARATARQTARGTDARASG